jgi:hypothetical protein
MKTAERFFVFAIDDSGKDVFITQGGLTRDINKSTLHYEDEADRVAEEMSDKYIWLTFGIGQHVDETNCGWE